MAKIGLVVKPGINAALKLAKELITWAESNSHKVLVNESNFGLLGDLTNATHVSAVNISNLIANADPIVTLGGDGTLIGIGRYVFEKSPLMIGVNFGALGFLTEISPSELMGILPKVLDGECEYATRSLFLAEVYRGSDKIFSSQAVNDAVVQKGVRDRMLDLDVTVDNEEVMRVRGDGIIVATPTGSTAYSLSAGGPIVHPSLGVAVITPICPHSLTNRPLIVNMESTFKISIPPYDGKVFLTVDGQVSTPLLAGDVLKIEKSSHTVRFVRSQKKTYFGILRTKLNWGIANKSE
jgi:NAD+ kinase